MNYKVLNENQRKRMLQISNNDFSMAWESPEFFNVLLGKLPAIRHYQKEEVIITVRRSRQSELTEPLLEIAI